MDPKRRKKKNLNEYIFPFDDLLLLLHGEKKLHQNCEV